MVLPCGQPTLVATNSVLREQELLPVSYFHGSKPKHSNPIAPQNTPRQRLLSNLPRWADRAAGTLLLINLEAFSSTEEHKLPSQILDQINGPLF